MPTANPTARPDCATRDKGRPPPGGVAGVVARSGSGGVEPAAAIWGALQPISSSDCEDLTTSRSVSNRRVALQKLRLSGGAGASPPHSAPPAALRKEGLVDVVPHLEEITHPGLHKLCEQAYNGTAADWNRRATFPRTSGIPRTIYPSTHVRPAAGGTSRTALEPKPRRPGARLVTGQLVQRRHLSSSSCGAVGMLG